MSLYALHLANGRTSNTGVFRLMGRLLSGSGVIESTGFTVSAQGTPDMTVKVSGSTTSDNLVIITATGDTYHGWNTANANVTISSNSTGVTVKDHIVAYIDTALTTTTPDNPGGLVLIAVRGTGTAAPTDTQINTATGSKPWLRLAEVSVANGAGSINAGNIVDLRPVIGLRNGIVTLPAIASGFTTGKLINWFTNSSSYSTTSNAFTPIGAFSDTFSFSGGPFQLTFSLGAFTVSGGNSYFGVRVGTTDYQVCPTTASSGTPISGTRFLPAASAIGTNTVLPLFRNGNSLTTTVPSYVEIFINIVDWGK